jgi:hypothetical protein
MRSPGCGKEQSLIRHQNTTYGKAVPFKTIKERRRSQRKAAGEKQLQLSFPINRTVEIRQEKTDGAGLRQHIYLLIRR